MIDASYRWSLFGVLLKGDNQRSRFSIVPTATDDPIDAMKDVLSNFARRSCWFFGHYFPPAVNITSPYLYPSLHSYDRSGILISQILVMLSIRARSTSRVPAKCWEAGLDWQNIEGNVCLEVIVRVQGGAWRSSCLIFTEKRLLLRFVFAAHSHFCGQFCLTCNERSHSSAFICLHLSSCCFVVSFSVQWFQANVPIWLRFYAV